MPLASTIATAIDSHLPPLTPTPSPHSSWPSLGCELAVTCIKMLPCRLERAGKGHVSECLGLDPGEPCNLLALTRGRCRFGVGPGYQIAEVQMHVAVRGIMDIHVDQEWTFRRMPDG